MISSTGRSNRGFTLLELMVVIFIIGIMSAAAVLTLPSDDGEALLNKQRFALMSALRTARAEAVFSGRSLGFLWAGNTGKFYVLTRGGWSPITEGVLAKPVNVDERVRSQITVAGQAVELPKASEEGDKPVTPQFVFLGDGQISPFDWQMATVEGKSVQFDQRLKVESQ